MLCPPCVPLRDAGMQQSALGVISASPSPQSKHLRPTSPLAGSRLKIGSSAGFQLLSLSFFGFSLPRTAAFCSACPYSGLCLQGKDTGQCRDEMGVDLNPAKEDLLIQELVVVMQQHRGAVHWGEADSRVSCLQHSGRRRQEKLNQSTGRNQLTR